MPSNLHHVNINSTPGWELFLTLISPPLSSEALIEMSLNVCIPNTILLSPESVLSEWVCNTRDKSIQQRKLKNMALSTIRLKLLELGEKNSASPGCLAYYKNGITKHLSKLQLRNLCDRIYLQKTNPVYLTRYFLPSESCCSNIELPICLQEYNSSVNNLCYTVIYRNDPQGSTPDSSPRMTDNENLKSHGALSATFHITQRMSISSNLTSTERCSRTATTTCTTTITTIPASDHSLPSITTSTNTRNVRESKVELDSPLLLLPKIEKNIVPDLPLLSETIVASNEMKRLLEKETQKIITFMLEAHGIHVCMLKVEYVPMKNHHVFATDININVSSSNNDSSNNDSQEPIVLPQGISLRCIREAVLELTPRASTSIRDILTVTEPNTNEKSMVNSILNSNNNMKKATSSSTYVEVDEETALRTPQRVQSARCPQNERNSVLLYASNIGEKSSKSTSNGFNTVKSYSVIEGRKSSSSSSTDNMQRGDQNHNNIGDINRPWSAPIALSTNPFDNQDKAVQHHHHHNIGRYNHGSYNHSLLKIKATARKKAPPTTGSRSNDSNSVPTTIVHNTSKDLTRLRLKLPPAISASSGENISTMNNNNNNNNYHYYSVSSPTIHSPPVQKKTITLCSTSVPPICKLTLNNKIQYNNDSNNSSRGNNGDTSNSTTQHNDIADVVISPQKMQAIQSARGKKPRVIHEYFTDQNTRNGKKTYLNHKNNPSKYITCKITRGNCKKDLQQLRDRSNYQKKNIVRRSPLSPTNK